jgi:iron-sulfur cluster assembly accessory protein
VLGGGCAGFSYQYDFCSEFDDQDEIINLDDEYKFVIDSTSLLFVLGTHLDYVNELGSSALKIINPNETSSCGCGKSFAI